MRWEDEQFVKVYTRDTVDWLALSYDARCLLLQLLRKVDRAGLLNLGRHGKRAVSIIVGAADVWAERISPALEELLQDGCVKVEGESLLIPNFIEAQQARQTDRARKESQRRRDRDLAAAGHEVTQADSHPQPVTPAVPGGHTESHGVTLRSDETRLDEKISPAPEGGEVPFSLAPPPSPDEEREKKRRKAEDKQREEEGLAVRRRIRAMLAEAYKAKTGRDYQAAKPQADNDTVVWLSEQAPPEDILRRWNNLLAWAEGGFPTVSGFYALRQHWNTVQVSVGTTTKSRAPVPAGTWSNPDADSQRF